MSHTFFVSDDCVVASDLSTEEGIFTCESFDYFDNNSTSKSSFQEEDRDELPLRRIPRKGIDLLGFTSKKKERRRNSSRHLTEEVEIKFHKARPSWISDANLTRKKASECTTLAPVPVCREKFQNAENLRSSFKKMIQPASINSQLSSWNYSLKEITPFHVSESVLNGFVDKCEISAEKNVYPRLTFHGTKAENIPSIQKLGLVTQQTLRPNTPWYTDAVWTAVNPSTSIHYSSDNMIFACAVLDDNHVFSTKENVSDGSNDNEIEAVMASPINKKEMPRAASQAKVNLKKEKFLGRNQHRKTSRPSTNVIFSQKKMNKNVSRMGDSVVLVHNCSHICPLFEIHYQKSSREIIEQIAYTTFNENRAHSEYSALTRTQLSPCNECKHCFAMLMKKRTQALKIERNQCRERKAFSRLLKE